MTSFFENFKNEVNKNDDFDETFENYNFKEDIEFKNFLSDFVKNKVLVNVKKNDKTSLDYLLNKILEDNAYIHDKCVWLNKKTNIFCDTLLKENNKSKSFHHKFNIYHCDKCFKKVKENHLINILKENINENLEENEFKGVLELPGTPKLPIIK